MTPEAAAEISPGGKDARRYERWIAAGLQVRSASQDALDRVQDVALQAGNLGRLSVADASLLALALELPGTLVTSDKTMLDVADRMGIRATDPTGRGITNTMSWRPRCKGCGRWFDAMPKKDECPICGSPVQVRPA